ncbi:MAG: FAD-dependent oxidoreductase [Oscillospiraceae bacterium]|jgi:glycine/D-amino acid oxidase-like deaminating enzyme
MNYLWTENIEMPHFPELKGDITTDVLVIGGGMAGVLCARSLRDKGVECVLAEAKTIGCGITRGTTAVLSAQHDTLYTDLVKKAGSVKAKQYLDANLQAVERFRAMSRDIDCDFEDRPSIMYTQGDASTLKTEALIVNRLGFPAEFITKTPLPIEITGAVKYPGMAQFHPLKFLAGAVKGLNIYENTFVHDVRGTTAYTRKGKISAKKIIIASHYPFINRRGLYFMKLYQTRSFIIVLENAGDVGATYVGTADGSIYFRNYKNLLIVGGGDHRTGTKVKSGGFARVNEFVSRYYPEAEKKYVWATQDCMSLDGVPYIGNYSPAMPNIYVATGFNEWGMTSSMVAAEILSDMITGIDNQFAPVFDPHRSMLKTQLFINLGETLLNFVMPVSKRCTHLGCSLKWNEAERSWDCPCHGSRFDERGKLIDNPAMRDARFN